MARSDESPLTEREFEYLLQTAVYEPPRRKKKRAPTDPPPVKLDAPTDDVVV